MIRLLAVDVDGTLVGDDLVISPAVREAVGKAIDRGVVVTIASGRMYPSTVPYARELGLGDVPLICYNGALVRTAESGETWFHRPLDPDLAVSIGEIVLRHGWHLHAYVNDVLHAPSLDDATAMYVRIARVQPVVGDVQKVLPEGPTKLLIVHDPADIPAVKAQLVQDLGERVSRVNITLSLPAFLEMMDYRVSKGLALAQVASMLGFAASEVMAVGDSENDLAMLAWAGTGVAMGNAAPAIKSRAVATTGTVDEDGLAQAIERFILEGETVPPRR